MEIIYTKCPDCGKAIWNNIEENKKRIANGQKPRPEYSCKDKEGCGWVKWAEKPKKVFTPQTPRPIVSNDLEILKLACEVAIGFAKASGLPPSSADMKVYVLTFYHDLKGILNPITKQEPKVEGEEDVDWDNK